MMVMMIAITPLLNDVLNRDRSTVGRRKVAAMQQQVLLTCPF